MRPDNSAPHPGSTAGNFRVRLFPLLLSPYILGAFNRFKIWLKRPFRAALQLGCVFVLLAVLCTGYRTALAFARSTSELAPGMDFSAPILFGLSLLLISSSFISAVGLLFTATDLPLILSLPVSAFQLFVSRLLLTAFAASFVLVIIGAPAFAAYLLAVHPGVAYAGRLFAPGGPFILCCAAVGLALSVLLINFLPAVYLRMAAFLILSFAFFGIAGLQLVLPRSDQKDLLSVSKGFSELLRDSRGDSLFLPWNSYSCLIHSNGAGSAAVCSAALGATCLAAIVFAFLCFRLFFRRGWENNFIVGVGQKRRAADWKLTRWLFRPLKSQFRALLFKEYQVLLRDTGQIMQLLLLLTVASIYLYNLYSFGSVDLPTIETRSWWSGVTAFVHVVVAVLLLSAFSARLVFPCVSMEGRSFFILKAAPLRIADYVKFKFWIWCPPFVLFSVGLTLIAGWLMKVPFRIELLSVTYVGCSAVGLVGLAVGIGSIYARFDWETPGQIISSFGNLAFTLLGLGLLAVTLVPLGYVLFLVSVLGDKIDNGQLVFVITSAVAFTGALNSVVAWQSLAAAVNSMSKIEEF